MKSSDRLTALLVRSTLSALLLFAVPAQLAGQPCPVGAAVAFTNVRLLSMDTATIVNARTVLVRDEKVAVIGPSAGAGAVAVPAGTCRIDGGGRVLMPGLSDMHVHTSEREMPLFLANGVTLVRELNGSPTHLALRDRIARGEVAGPRLLVTSALLAGVPQRNVRFKLIGNPDEATAAAREIKAAGYDFLKIYDGLSKASYDAFVQAGRTLGLRLDGHVPAEVGLAAVIESGQSIQHMDKIVFSLAGHTMDTSKFAEARRLFGGRGMWVTPTIASLNALDAGQTSAFAAALKRPEMAYADSGLMVWWQSLSGSRERTGPSRWNQYQTALLRVLRETNTRFLLGTDAANPLMVAGFAVHEELDALVRDGGFSTFDALRAATRSVGEFLGEPLNGRVAVGSPASLLLIDGDPLANLSVLRSPAGTMIAGRWYPRAELDTMILRAKRPGA